MITAIYFDSVNHHNRKYAQRLAMHPPLIPYMVSIVDNDLEPPCEVWKIGISEIMLFLIIIIRTKNVSLFQQFYPFLRKNKSNIQVFGEYRSGM